MIQESIIRKLTDYVLLNACSVSSSGLYNGKAGLSLALFEVARSLQDEYLEEQAFELLQEALLSKTEDSSFENGLSGIGYVLLHLIENKFIEADFGELFGENHVKIENSLNALKEKRLPAQSFSYLGMVHYLCRWSRFHNKYNNESEHLIQYLSKESGKFLSERFVTLETNGSVFPQMETLYFLEHYLTTAASCPTFKPEMEMLKSYAGLYRRGKLASNFTIGHSLVKIAEELNDVLLKEVGNENKKSALLNLYPDTLPLSRILDLLCLLNEDKSVYRAVIERLEKYILNEENEQLLEHRLTQAVHSTDFVAGYQSGIARLLLYDVYQNKKQTIWMH